MNNKDRRHSNNYRSIKKRAYLHWCSEHAIDTKQYPAQYIFTNRMTGQRFYFLVARWGRLQVEGQQTSTLYITWEDFVSADRTTEYIIR